MEFSLKNQRMKKQGMNDTDNVQINCSHPVTLQEILLFGGGD
jgi:hypothetical protein